MVVGLLDFFIVGIVDVDFVGWGGGELFVVDWLSDVFDLVWIDIDVLCDFVFCDVLE